MAAAVTEAWPSAGGLRRREPLGVSGRRFGRSRRPGRARPRPGGREGPGGGKGDMGAATSGCSRLWPCTPAPEARGRVGAKRPLTAASPVSRPTRRSRERPLALCFDCPRERGTVPLRFQTFPYFFPANGTSRWLGWTGYHPPVGEGRLLGFKAGSSEQDPSPSVVWPPRKGDKNDPFRPRNSVQLPLHCGSVFAKDRSFGSSNCWNHRFTQDAATR